jgi:hypothetical protein
LIDNEEHGVLPDLHAEILHNVHKLLTDYLQVKRETKVAAENAHFQWGSLKEKHSLIRDPIVELY